jgi:hypothetical protein
MKRALVRALRSLEAPRLLSGAKFEQLVAALASAGMPKSAKPYGFGLTAGAATDSFLWMIRQVLRARDKLVSKMPVTGELLRGTLLERTVRHSSGCPKCARGEGHQVFVLTVTYPGGRTRQISVRRERVEEVRRWLANYQELKEAIEAICELNHDLLRPDRAASKSRKKQHD